MAARKITGMHQREGSSNWHLRVMIPTALREAFYEGRAFIRISLNTPDEGTARTAALAHHLTHADTFARQSAQLKPMVQATISPALADELAKRARIRILAMDDAIRFSPEALGAFLTAFAPEPVRYFSADLPRPPKAPVVIGADGMTPEQLQALTRVHESLALGLSSSLKLGQLRYGEQDATREAAALGLSADWSRNRPAVLTILRAVVGAWIDVGRRNLGDAVDTPAMTEVPADLLPSPAGRALPRRSTDNRKSLLDVRDEWAAEQSKDSRAKMERALRMLAAAKIPMALDALTRQHALDFRTYIRATMNKASAKTQSDVLSAIQRLLNYAVKEKGYLALNPWAGTAIAKGKSARRDTWDNDDLETLLSSDLHQSYVLPADVKGGHDAAYWLIPMAILTGCRIAELCQLQLRDVLSRDGILMLSINEDDDKAVKSEAGVRQIAVHSKLIDLGFADFVADQRTRAVSAGLDDSMPLFPDLHSKPSRTGAVNASDFHRDLFKTQGLYRRWRDFHSLRTTVGTALRAVHPPLGEALITALMGHEAGNVGASNYHRPAPATLKRTIETLEFPALLALKRSYPVRNVDPPPS